MQIQGNQPVIYQLDGKFSRRTKVLFLVYGVIGLALAVLL